MTRYLEVSTKRRKENSCSFIVTGRDCGDKINHSLSFCVIVLLHFYEERPGLRIFLKKEMMWVFFHFTGKAIVFSLCKATEIDQVTVFNLLA